MTKVSKVYFGWSRVSRALGAGAGAGACAWGAGRLGGEVVAEGTPAEIAKSEVSSTGRYLRGEIAETPSSRRRASGWLTLKAARTHNLRGDTVKIPLGVLTAFTGVSGSGKSSLAFDTLYAEGQRRYVESLSALTKLPYTLVRMNMGKIHAAMSQIRTVISGLTRGIPLELFDRGLTSLDDLDVNFYPVTSALGVSLPSNAPAVKQRAVLGSEAGSWLS